MSHEIKRPEIVPVLKGQKYSRACGAEARHQARAEFDGVAIDGVLMTVEEYFAPLRLLGYAPSDFRDPPGVTLSQLADKPCARKTKR